MKRQTSSGSAAGGSSTVHSTAVDGHGLTIDLTQRPTRSYLGYLAGQNFVVYQQGFPWEGLIDTTVILPTGTLQVPAYIVHADGGNPLATDDPNHLRPPQQIIMNRKFASAPEALSSLANDAAVLGIGQTGAFKTDTSYDAVHDWLSVHIYLSNPASDGSVDAMYSFGIDLYHNPTLDRVVQDGVFFVDLRRLPTREDLAFRPTYSKSVVAPEPGKALRIHLTLANGVIEREVADVTSNSESASHDDPRGLEPPLRTTVTLPNGTPEQIKTCLLADAAALGVDPAAVESAFAHPSGKQVAATVRGRFTEVYEVAVEFGATLGEGSWPFAASATYSFTYHR